MLDFLFNFLTNNIIFPLIIPGMVIGSLLIIGSFVLPDILSKYKIAICAIGIIILLFFVFYSGKQSSEVKSQIEIVKKDLQISQLTTKAAEVTIQVVTKYVDKVRVVEKIKTEYVNVEKVITPDIDRKYGNVPYGLVRLFNSAAIARIPDTPSPFDATPSTVGLTALTANVTSNYLICKDTENQLTSLQEWVKEQQALINTKK